MGSGPNAACQGWVLAPTGMRECKTCINTAVSHFRRGKVRSPIPTGGSGTAVAEGVRRLWKGRLHQQAVTYSEAPPQSHNCLGENQVIPCPVGRINSDKWVLSRMLIGVSHHTTRCPGAPRPAWSSGTLSVLPHPKDGRLYAVYPPFQAL